VRQVGNVFWKRGAASQVLVAEVLWRQGDYLLAAAVLRLLVERLGRRVTAAQIRRIVQNFAEAARLRRQVEHLAVVATSPDVGAVALDDGTVDAHLKLETRHDLVAAARPPHILVHAFRLGKNGVVAADGLLEVEDFGAAADAGVALLGVHLAGNCLEHSGDILVILTANLTGEVVDVLVAAAGIARLDVVGFGSDLVVAAHFLVLVVDRLAAAEGMVPLAIQDLRVFGLPSATVSRRRPLLATKLALAVVDLVAATLVAVVAFVHLVVAAELRRVVEKLARAAAVELVAGIGRIL